MNDSTSNPPVTYVSYTCHLCKTEGRVVPIRARVEGEEILNWVKFVQAIVAADHTILKPLCASFQCDLKIPLPSTESKIGEAMTTERDEAGVFHIDGPPYRGFAVEDKGGRVEVVYRTLRYAGTKEECETGFKMLLDLFKAEMNDLYEIEVAKKTPLAMKVIWWRKRVEYAEDPENPGYWRFYCRFATTPDCPMLFDQWETKEGAVNRNVKEIIG